MRSALHRRLTALETGRKPKVSPEMIARLAAEFDNRMLRLAATFDDADADVSEAGLAVMSPALQLAHALRFGGPGVHRIMHEAGRAMP
jgi:hypothetical protein